MSRWYIDGHNFRQDLGRLGDTVELGALPAVDAAFADILVHPSVAKSGVVCGSPNEVANKPELFGSLDLGAFDASTTSQRSTSIDALANQRLFVWMSIALNGGDQLRQKIAWVLSQLLVVSFDTIEVNHVTENFMVRLARQLHFFTA
jgi:hypothetical protein